MAIYFLMGSGAPEHGSSNPYIFWVQWLISNDMAQDGNWFAIVWYFIIIPADEVRWGHSFGQRPSLHASVHPFVHLVMFPSIPMRKHGRNGNYTDVTMTTMASQITSLTIVYSTVYSDADQRKHQSSASLAFVWGIDQDRWFPRTKCQLRGKCFHLMTSSWGWPEMWHTDVAWPPPKFFDFGQYWHSFGQLVAKKFWVSGHSRGNAWKEWSEMWHTDVLSPASLSLVLVQSSGTAITGALFYHD